jgi:hypothetical protein
MSAVVVALRPAQSWRDVLGVHEDAEAFPALPADELRALGEDIRDHGLENPIGLVLRDGDIFVADGRQRLDAMELVGLPVIVDGDLVPGLKTIFLPPGVDVRAYVISQGLKRRHMDESARAMVAARLVKDPFSKKRTPDRVHVAQAAEMLNVGTRSVTRAQAVIKHGTPELVEAVDKGKVKVRAAARIATKPPAEQRAALKAGDTQDKRPEPAAASTPRGRPRGSTTNVPPGSVGAGNTGFGNQARHIIGDIRATLDTLALQKEEILALPKAVRVELLHDFGRVLGLVDSQVETASGVRSTLDR